MRVLIITEFEPSRLGTGVTRRLSHYIDHYQRQNVAPEVLPLFAEPGVSFQQSARRARSVVDQDVARRADEIVYLGVGSVPMLWGALGAVKRSRRTVAFDQCDSLLTQAAMALRSGDRRLVVFAVMRGLLVGLGSRRLVVDYIDRRDRRRDRLFNTGRLTRHIAMTAPSELAGLAPVDLASIDRIVIPGDLTSSHLARGMRAFQRAAEEGLHVRVEFFGPSKPLWMPPGGVYRGFAPQLLDLYAGDTVVFVPNVGGGGIPNKLYEASLSGRPVIAHSSIIDRVSTPLIGWTWTTAADLSRILRSVGSPEGVLPEQLRS